MRVVFSLTSAESRRLIAKGVLNLPAVQKAMSNGKIIVAGGTTNAFVAEELLGVTIEEKCRYTAGIITQGAYQCVTPEEGRIKPYVIENGKISDRPWVEVLEEFSAEDVFIKGANAIDAQGNAGVMVSGPGGGTIGRAFGVVGARGSHLIIPVGLEKMIPSVPLASRAAGINKMDDALGQAVGLIPVVNGQIVNELTALEIMFGVKATCIGAGGVGGSEGAVTLVIEGERGDEALSFIKTVKGEPAIGACERKCNC